MTKRVEILYKNRIYSQSGVTNKAQLRPTRRPGDGGICVRSMIRNVLTVSKDEAIITLFSGCTETNEKNIIKFINANRINSVYFFVEDVFRLYNSNTNFSLLETYPLALTPNDIRSYELDIIDRIIKKSKCKYRIFHCEKEAVILSNNYNLKIEYFDWFFLESTAINTPFNQDAVINTKISCFNLRDDWHRSIIMSLIKDFDGIFSLNNPGRTDLLINNSAVPLPRFNQFIREKIVKGHISLVELPILWDGTIDEKTGKVIEPCVSQQLDNTNIITSAFVNVITETRFASLMPNISEKTIKPMLVRRPFIMIGPVGNLALLRELGFKTFNKWWDESYDLELDHNKRIEMIYSIIKSINNMLLEELTLLLDEMESVLNHNFTQLSRVESTMTKYLK